MPEVPEFLLREIDNEYIQENFRQLKDYLEELQRQVDALEKTNESE